MDRDLIVRALKSSCGNKNLRFQVIVHNSKLHIYINRKADYLADYVLLADTISSAIASLGLDTLSGIWLYSRKLGEVEPDWQVFMESPIQIDEEEMDTLGNSTLDRAEVINLQEFEDFQDEVSIEDTGLLQNTGLIHGKPLEEEEIHTFAKESDLWGIETKTEIHGLAEYCFVSNRKILTGDIIPPQKEIIRLVKFFHHLSSSNQHKILPGLDDYFKGKTTTDPENAPIAVKRWLKQITELPIEDRSTMAIWLSRYCFDSLATLAEFKSIEEKKPAANKVKRSSTEYGFAPVNAQTDKEERFDDFDKNQARFIDRLIIPVVWILATVVLIFLGVYTNGVDTRSTSQEIPALCQTTIGSPNYCRLGVNLAGEKAIARSEESIFPLSQVTQTVAAYGCQRFANVKAGAFNSLDPTQNPVVSSYGEKIFPHIYVVEAVQKHATQSGNIRVGCVYTTGEGERSPTKLASDVIPLNWPQEYYRPENVSDTNFSFGIYTNLINLGLYTLFSAISLAIVSRFKLGIDIKNRLQTVYQIAFILGISQLLAVSLPAFNLLGSIVFFILAILGCDRLIKSFSLNFKNGYSTVFLGILTILALQFLLYGISLKLINSLMQSIL
ncbi:hypothetical protein I4641_14800 [Waterburya agarophytonicola K14]|uniref:Uncharacterized protein n=1 Tax=Waterburya agarophytonicola KI4 TaxID=2874699 RepID=A0A964BU57_9CYAN|nr:hypothetical protein [Waterburya agarophytonicola]MCC0178247.1 hypothetical protein [Waterburya agarophytonicola KI4]